MTEQLNVDECKTCEGSGSLAFDCPECEGNGWVEDPEDGGSMTCPECDDEVCPDCGGTGESNDRTD